jgi:hypothetical protein
VDPLPRLPGDLAHPIQVCRACVSDLKPRGEFGVRTVHQTSWQSLISLRIIPLVSTGEIHGILEPASPFLKYKGVDFHRRGDILKSNPATGKVRKERLA